MPACSALNLVMLVVQGKQRLEALLERVSLSSDYKARKVLHIAAERGLNSVLTSTCKASTTYVTVLSYHVTV
jgi:hypothetical protein